MRRGYNVWMAKGERGKEGCLEAGDVGGTIIRLPYELEFRDYQRPIWDYMMQDVPGLRGVTIWPRRNGKDLIGLNILIAKALQRKGLYLYVGPYHKQTRKIIWLGMTNSGRKFLDYIPPEAVVASRSSVMEIDLINGSMVIVVGSDNYDALMGSNPVGIVFTEYSLQNASAWDFMRPILSDNGGWALFNYTARGHNHGYAMKTMAEKNPKWFYQLLTRDDTGYPSLESIEEDRRSGMRESLIRQEYFNDFNASSEETFIPMELVSCCMEKAAALPASAYDFAPRILSCDVAYAPKGDKATIGYRQGRKFHFLRWYVGMDNQAFADEIARYIRAVKPHYVNIDAGRGEGVISRLDRLGYGHLVNPVHFGGKVYEEGIANMKALMWLRMLDWFLDTNKPDMTDLDRSKYANEEVSDDLITELSTPHMCKDEKNRISVETKASLRTRGESSKDLAETVALSFAIEVEDERPDPVELSQVIQNEVQELEYNPLSYFEDM